MTKSLIAVAVATLATAGCQTWGPTWSELSGSREFNKTTMFLKPAIIESVDGQSAYPTYPIKLEPGTHVVVIQGPYRQRGGGLLDSITVNMEPCKRYYVNAQFNNFVRPTFEPVIDHVEDVAGCSSSSPVAAAN
jgi:hypothetical protein